MMPGPLKVMCLSVNDSLRQILLVDLVFLQLRAQAFKMHISLIKQ